MKVNALGKEEVDIGSNRDEFWFWARQDPEPFQYFCRYDDLNQGRFEDAVADPAGVGDGSDGARAVTATRGPVQARARRSRTRSSSSEKAPRRKAWR